MSFSTMPRMTASQIEDYMVSLKENAKYDVFCVDFNGSKTEMVMCSQREKTRTFSTLESARKACDFTGTMTVVGK
mgnify:CR=1 FL=1